MGFDLGFFALMGTQAATNPVQMANAGVFVLVLLLLRRTGQEVFLGFIVNFVLTLVIAGLLFDLGALGFLLTAPRFFTVAIWGYLALGVVFVIVGTAFFREWRLFFNGGSTGFAGFIHGPKLLKTIPSGLAAILAVVLAFISNVWPLPYDVFLQRDIVLSSAGAGAGSFFYLLGELLVYELLHNVPVLCVVAVFFLNGRVKGRDFFQKRASLVSIMMSAAFFAVGGALIHLFYISFIHPPA